MDSSLENSIFDACIVCGKEGEGSICIECLQIGITQCECKKFIRKNVKCSCLNKETSINYHNLLKILIKKFLDRKMEDIVSLNVEIIGDHINDLLILNVPKDLQCNELLYLVHNQTKIPFENLLMTKDNEICTQFTPTENMVVIIQVINMHMPPENKFQALFDEKDIFVNYIVSNEIQSSICLDLDKLDEKSIKAIIWQHTNVSNASYVKKLNKIIVLIPDDH